ncbi:MAG: hypothetical protein Ct9H300mP27_01390 [Chloroflexota bacterium]|nr:MAG: hypothetical protein Ct9H300mP27_01390 [Chloroflexota bacterium]
MRKPSGCYYPRQRGVGPIRLVKWDPGIAIPAEAYPDYVPNPDVLRGPIPNNSKCEMGLEG